MASPEVWTKPADDPRKIVMNLDVFEGGRLADLFDEPTVTVPMRAMRQGASPWMFFFGVEDVLLYRLIRSKRGEVPVPVRLRERDARNRRSVVWLLAVFFAFVVAAAVGSGPVQSIALVGALASIGASIALLLFCMNTRVEVVLTRDQGHVVLRGLDRTAARCYAAALAEGRSGVTGPGDAWHATMVPVDEDGIVPVTPHASRSDPRG
ncbi:MAG TPA: hypothetical protein VHE83_14760 [Mycobacteriales bacterium]|nr:hypothetical protein [Mycobacteriales bacterium]